MSFHLDVVHQSTMTNNWWWNRRCQFCLNHVFTFSLDRSCSISPILLNGYQLFSVNELKTANTNLPSIFFCALLLDSCLMKEGKKTPKHKNSAKKLKLRTSREASRKRSRLDRYYSTAQDQSVSVLTFIKSAPRYRTSMLNKSCQEFILESPRVGVVRHQSGINSKTN